jgi:hypothetical protein
MNFEPPLPAHTRCSPSPQQQRDGWSAGQSRMLNGSNKRARWDGGHPGHPSADMATSTAKDRTPVFAQRASACERDLGGKLSVCWGYGRALPYSADGVGGLSSPNKVQVATPTITNSLAHRSPAQATILTGNVTPLCSSHNDRRLHRSRSQQVGVLLLLFGDHTRCCATCLAFM